MKQGIHPEYVECTVRCTCGNTWTTHATVPEMRLDLCDKCHPFYTGQQKLVDTGGRVQRFADKFGGAGEGEERDRGGDPCVAAGVAPDHLGDAADATPRGHVPADGRAPAP